MAILVDLFLFAILLLSVYLGYRRGFVRSFLGAVSFFVALCVAMLLTAPLANFFMEQFAYDLVSDAVHSVFVDTQSFSATEDLLASLESSSSSFGEMISRFGLTTEEALTYVQDNALLPTEDLLEGLVSMAARPIAFMASVALAFLLLFALTSAVLVIVRTVLDLAAKLPLLHQANQLFGLMFGALYGIFLVCVISAVLLYVWPLLSGLWPDLFAANVPEQSLLFGLISKYNLLSLLFGWIADTNPTRILKGI